MRTFDSYVSLILVSFCAFSSLLQIQGLFGSPCTTDDDCGRQNFTCNNGSCVCKEGIIIHNGTMCVSITERTDIICDNESITCEGRDILHNSSTDKNNQISDSKGVFDCNGTNNCDEAKIYEVDETITPTKGSDTTSVIEENITPETLSANNSSTKRVSHKDNEVENDSLPQDRNSSGTTLSLIGYSTSEDIDVGNIEVNEESNVTVSLDSSSKVKDVTTQRFHFEEILNSSVSEDFRQPEIDDNSTVISTTDLTTLGLTPVGNNVNTGKDENETVSDTRKSNETYVSTTSEIDGYNSAKEEVKNNVTDETLQFITTSSTLDTDLTVGTEATTLVHVNLGEQCSHSAQCLLSTNYSTCSNSTCICQDGYLRKNTSEMGEICAQISLGDPCSNSTECSDFIPWSECSNSRCACREGFVHNASDGSCQQRKLGEKCETDTECSKTIYGSECSTENVCACKIGFKPINDGTSCTGLVVGDRCSNDDECLNENLNAVCRSRMCICDWAKGFIADDFTEKCRHITIGDHCSSGPLCTLFTHNSKCVDQKCICKEGFIARIDKLSCVERTIFDQCETDKDCTGAFSDTECINNTCVCLPGMYFENETNSCKYHRLNETFCMLDSECSTIISNAVCYNDKCQCRLGYRQNYTEQNCVERLLSDDCNVDEDCFVSVNNSVCRNNLCSCASGYFATEQNDTCHRRFIGDSCDIMKDCVDVIKNSDCISSICQCALGQIKENNGSCRPRLLHDQCDQDKDCGILQNSQCVNKSCECIPGFMGDKNDTYCRKVLLGDHCNVNTDCSHSVNESICSNNTCSCALGFVGTEDKMNCRQRTFIDACTMDKHCKYLTNNSFCIDSQCRCFTGYQLIKTSGIPIANSSDVSNVQEECKRRKIYDNCSLPEDCLTQNSNCSNGLCECFPGYLVDAEREHCLKRKIFDVCFELLDCKSVINNSHCNNDTCQCDTGYYVTSENSTCQGRLLEDSCTSDVGCSAVINGSVCRNETCQCKPGYYGVNNGLSCIRKLSRGFNIRGKLENREHSEIKTTAIISPFTVYSKTTPPRHHGGHNKPIRQGFAGDLCTDDHDCVMIGNSYCDFNSSTCKCLPTFMAMGKGSECVPRRIGDGCDSDTDCHKSWCINDMCSCKVGFKPMIDLTISNIRTYCKMLRIKDNCSSTLECQSVVANSNCSQGNCICNSGFFSNGNLNLCVKRRIYDSCKLNSDCIDAVNNSVCTNGACACTLGYKIVNRNETCEKRHIGDTCNKTEDCSYAVDKSVCKNDVCVCKTGYKVENENRTCTLRTIFDSCEVDTDCSSAIKHSKCFEGSCTCALGFYVTEHNATCQKYKITDHCSDDVNCESAVSNSLCDFGECACSIGYDAIDDNKLCVRRPTYLGDPCFYPGHCDQVDAVSVCNGTCACPSGYFIPRDRKNCTEDPRHIGDACFLRDSCNIIKYSRCGKPSYTCECVEGYFADNDDSICREYAAKIGDRCLSDVHCTNIKNAVCGRNNNTCQCIYKYHPSIRDVECRPRMKVKLPDYPDPWLGGICDITEREPCPNWNITNQWCMPEEGRVNTRCRCLPGFANRFDEGECHEIQTYFIRFNISEELGCNKREDGPRCFIYSPFTYMKPYSNPRTRPFRVMKLRIQILGLDLALNSSDRYISSEIINMTSSETGLQVSALLQIKADFYNVINASDILDELLSHMERNDGKLGDSQLKIAKSYTDHILIDDFDECSDWNNYTSDCSPFAWCINTYGSFMCSCHYGKHDYKRDRPGRICREPPETTTVNVACSGGTCETRWEWVGLALACLFILLISFIVYEVYSKKKEILKADPAYASLKRVKTLRRIQSRHSSKRKKEKPLLSLSQSIEGMSYEKPPSYSEEP